MAEPGKDENGLPAPHWSDAPADGDAAGADAASESRARGGLPSREAVRRFIRESPGRVG